MVDRWQIRPSTFFLLAYAITLVLIPIPGGLQFLMPFVSILFFIRLRSSGRIKKGTMLDYALILAYTFLGLFFMIYLQVWALESIPWWKLILVGIAADVVASLLGTVPVIGDFMSGIINMIIAITVIGGIEGAFIAMVMVIIGFIPGPSLIANTVLLVIFKIVSEAIL